MHSSSSLPPKQTSPLFFGQPVTLNFISFFKILIKWHKFHDPGFLFFVAKHYNSKHQSTRLFLRSIWVHFVWIVFLVGQKKHRRSMGFGLSYREWIFRSQKVDLYMDKYCKSQKPAKFAGFSANVSLGIFITSGLTIWPGDDVYQL